MGCEVDWTRRLLLTILKDVRLCERGSTPTVPPAAQHPALGSPRPAGVETGVLQHSGQGDSWRWG